MKKKKKKRQREVINLSSIFTEKETLNERKKHTEKEKKVFQKKDPRKEFISKSHKQLNIKNKTKITTRKWAIHLNGHIMKKACTWPFST